MMRIKEGLLGKGMSYEEIAWIRDEFLKQRESEALRDFAAVLPNSSTKAVKYELLLNGSFALHCLAPCVALAFVLPPYACAPCQA